MVLIGSGAVSYKTCVFVLDLEFMFRAVMD